MKIDDSTKEFLSYSIKITGKIFAHCVVAFAGVLAALALILVLFKFLKSEPTIRNVYEVSYSLNGEEKNCFAFEPKETDNQIKITTIDGNIIYIDMSTLDSELICENFGYKTAEEIQELKDSDKK